MLDIKAYIESGVLEQYVLGTCSELQRLEVERYALEYPEIQKEIDSISAAFEIFAETQKVKIPEGTHQKMLDLIEDLPPRIQPIKKEIKQPEVISTGFSKWAVAAGFALALLAGGYAFSLNNNLAEAQAEKSNLENSLAELTDNCAQTTNEKEALEQKIAILEDSGNQPILMAGSDLAPEAIAKVHYNNESNASYLEIVNLPPPTTGKQYQLWAIVNDVPVDMGVITYEEVITGLVSVPFIETPSAFAITLEDFGGKPSPDLEQLFVIGTV